MKIFSGYLFISLAFGAFSTAFRIAETQTVLPAERQAMQWLADNTVPSATIVTVTGKLPLLDPVTEWMPALTGRYVATSAFGVEWVDGKRFSTILQSHRDLQACANRDDSCLQGWISDYGAYNYIYFSMGESDFPLRIDLLQEPDYQLVYVSKGVSIFKLVSLARRLSVQADSHIRYANLSLGHP